MFCCKALALQTEGIVSIGDGTTALFSDDPFLPFSDACSQWSVRQHKCWLGRA
jgi:hypothetical protein